MTAPTTFDTVLVANRGEIAVRVLRSARAAGYRTVAVFSEADRRAVHTREADVAVCIGPAPARESYLDIDAIITAARETGARAIHPGYGFLAENADFARACADAGVVFVGPPADAIELMGDKAAAKRLMAEAGVPLLPGYQDRDQSDDRLRAEAKAIGTPLMVKAAAGGGGKGMRLVTDEAGLDQALATARREALSAFGNDDLILERALLRPRHVEVQVLADAHGRVLAVGDRDCSVQRRHQKVVEEAPAPGVPDEVRSAMHHAAVEAARAVDYVGAGTVEFLLGTEGDHAGTFAFLEMNTRLQVEHPVTELVTGLDLVDWQLRIAAGATLDVDPADLRPDGHAIEVRLYAEGPAPDFLPQTGTVLRWSAPTGPGLRIDTGIDTGSEVSAHYDPMLAKVIAHGRDRDEARRRLVGALAELTCAGVTTNRGFLRSILQDPVLAAAEMTTAFLDERPIDLLAPDAEALALIAGAVHAVRRARSTMRSPGLTGWTNAAWLGTSMRLEVDGSGQPGPHDVRVTESDGMLVVDVAGDRHEVALHDAERLAAGITTDATGSHWVGLAFADLVVRDLLLLPPDAAAAAGEGALVAPMHGVVTAVHVAAGDEVAAGDPVVAIEAMKMEHVLRASVDGTIERVAQVGDQVASGDVLGVVNPTDG